MWITGNVRQNHPQQTAYEGLWCQLQHRRKLLQTSSRPSGQEILRKAPFAASTSFISAEGSARPPWSRLLRGRPSLSSPTCWKTHRRGRLLRFARRTHCWPRAWPLGKRHRRGGAVLVLIPSVVFTGACLILRPPGCKFLSAASLSFFLLFFNYFTTLLTVLNKYAQMISYV